MKTVFSGATRQLHHEKFEGNSVIMKHQLMHIPVPEGGLKVGNVYTFMYYVCIIYICIYM